MLKKIKINYVWIALTGFIAIIFHAILLHSWIDVTGGQNLTFFNILSQVFWFAVLFAWLIALWRPSLNLTILLYPLAALSIILVVIFSGSHVINFKENTKVLIHILLSFLAVSVLIIASIQAVFIYILNQALRKKYSSSLTQSLPPLQRMESLLFQWVALGFCILTAVIITGFSFFSKSWPTDLLHHMLFAFSAWIVFGILILGRIYFGWRGRIAIRWTFTGVMLLLITSLSSQFWLH